MIYFFTKTFALLTCCQVFLGQSGGLDAEGNELPRLVYVSREKRPGFQHHKKAGAMNALVSRCLLILDVDAFMFWFSLPFV